MFKWLTNMFSGDKDVQAAFGGPTVADPAYSYGWSGDKFLGGFGETRVYEQDMVTLRMRSEQVWTDNLYARGIIDRIVTNLVSTGLRVTPAVNTKFVGITSKQKSDFAVSVEDIFELYADNAERCCYQGKYTLAQIQHMLKVEACLNGDCLQVYHYTSKDPLPKIQLVPGCRISTPLKKMFNTNIKEGIEYDKRGRQIAYWIAPTDFGGEYTRVPAKGKRSGRTVAKLYTSSITRVDQGRGLCLLAIILQSLKELDRYRDAAARKAVINSMLAMFITKNSQVAGSGAYAAGAVKKNVTEVTDPDGTTRKFHMSSMIPGVVLDELAEGEEPKSFDGGSDVDFPVFEEAMINAIAWAIQIPPSVLKMKFSANYSASQAEIHEMNAVIAMDRLRQEADFGRPLYREWLLSAAAADLVPFSTDIVRAYSGKDWIASDSWLSSEWFGMEKPSADIVKTAKGNQLLIAMGVETHTSVARKMAGTNYSRNMKTIAEENKLLAAAAEPKSKHKQKYGTSPDKELEQEVTE